MRAVFAETLGCRISGSGRSFKETLARERDLDRRVGFAASVRAAGLVVRFAVGLAAGDDFAGRGVAAVLVLDAARGDDLAFAVRPFDFETLPEAFALRRSRRCVLLIASTNSSFFIPCQPGMP